MLGGPFSQGLAAFLGEVGADEGGADDGEDDEKDDGPGGVAVGGDGDGEGREGQSRHRNQSAEISSPPEMCFRTTGFLRKSWGNPSSMALTSMRCFM